MGEGRIVERGTHEELLGGDGLYATLWQVQAGLVTSLPDTFLGQAAARAAQVAADH